MPFKLGVLAGQRALIGTALVGSGAGALFGAAFLVAADRAPAPGAVQAPIDQQALAAVTSVPAPAAQPLRLAAVARVSVDQQALDSIRAAQSERRRAMAAAEPFRATGAAQNARELDCLTQAVYFEARGETSDGQAAVAQVVLNRVRHPSYPKTVCGVVYQGSGSRGCQFSFACDGRQERVRESAAWTRARRVAARALSGVAVAEIGAATHFHTVSVAPAWSASLKRVSQVGLHVFYKLQRKGASVQQARAEPAPQADIVQAVDPVAPVEVETVTFTSLPTAAPDETKASEAAPAASEGQAKAQAPAVATAS